MVSATNRVIRGGGKKMIEVGRVCVKIAGRDAGKKCVIVSVANEKFVLIDGETRRRKCNTLHLEPLDQILDIKKDASREEVVNAFKNLGIELKATKAKKKSVRPRTLRRSKLAKAPAAPAQKAEKSAPKVVDAQIVKTEETEEKKTAEPDAKKAKIAEKKK